MCYAVDSTREVYIPSKEIEEILDNFRCINSTDMYYDVLKKGMHHYKETEGGCHPCHGFHNNSIISNHYSSSKNNSENICVQFKLDQHIGLTS